MRVKEGPSFLKSQETNEPVSPGVGPTFDLPLRGVSVQPLALHCHVWRVNNLSHHTGRAEADGIPSPALSACGMRLT